MSELDDFAALAASGLFDRAWYTARYPDVAAANLDPLLHYFRFGAAEGRQPNAYFHPEWYREQAGIADTTEPLLHYIQIGEAAGIPPHPALDPTWYRMAYCLEPHACVLTDLLLHRGDGRLANPSVYGARHLQRYADASISDPMAHYIQLLATSGSDADCDHELISDSGVFDTNHYLINGADVMEASIDPVRHFCEFGWREGRDPNLYFKTKWYLLTNPDVERLGINPLSHYIAEGERAGRRPVVYFEPEWYRDRYNIPPEMLSLAHFIQHRRSQAFSPNSLFDAGWYLARYRELVGSNRDPFAHFLQAGMYRDLDPSPGFNSAAYRRGSLGRHSRQFKRLLHPDGDNPLVHYMRSRYR